MDDVKVKTIINIIDDSYILQNEINKLYNLYQKNNCKFNNNKFFRLRLGKDEDIKSDSLYFSPDMSYVINEADQ